ncbi:hypothetical protein [Spirosoma fluviale]|uniref:Uncharacterized protein n=1 Tax=Spirosoma fluviale TaxID=1597977 RepID=A0A286F5M6_9BACT|nr:hypothetical protein [Spirosoma fluviale]SOD78194.1 hypothetical protein SAMN06269250_0340 [Spirosoma fluviale]
MKSLKTVLIINAVSSGATGLLLLALANPIAQLFGQSSTGIFTEVGLFLVAFAVFVFYQSRQHSVSTGAVRFIIALDLLWVVASVILLVWPSVELTGLGQAAIAAVALWVALMAYLQTNGLKKVTA